MEEEERFSHLFSGFDYRNDELKKKKKKLNDSQSGGAVFLPSIHPGKKPNAQSNLPMIQSQSQNSRVISPYLQKNKTLECNSSEIISPYFQKAVKEEEGRDSEVPLKSESRGISPYFQKKRVEPDSNSRWLISNCFQEAVKQQKRYLNEHCNFPNEIDNNGKKKKKKRRKKKGNDTFESFKEEENKTKVQNFRMDDEDTGAELPVSNSNFSTQRKVSPFFQKGVKEEQEMNLETEVESKSTVISPYFEKKKSLVSDSVSNSASDSSFQCILSPYLPKAVKQEERSSSEQCNSPNKIVRRKVKKRKRTGHDTVECFKKRENKIDVKNFRVENQKMNVQQPISCSQFNSQRRVSPYFEKAVKEKEGNSEEATKKEQENEESFKVEEERKTNAQDISMEDEKMKLPKKKTRAPPVRVVSPYFPINEEDAQKPVRAMYFNKLNVAYKRKTPNNNWKPPPSRFHLLQEDHYHDPWRVMVICMLLNCTSGVQVVFGLLVLVLILL